MYITLKWQVCDLTLYVHKKLHSKICVIHAHGNKEDGNVYLAIFDYCREQRSGNTLYQELSFQDAEALGEIDEGADITGIWFVTVFITTNSVTPDSW